MSPCTFCSRVTVWPVQLRSKCLQWQWSCNSNSIPYRRVRGCLHSVLFVSSIRFYRAGSPPLIPVPSAGVLFTMNPVSGNTREMVVESCWGLGEGTYAYFPSLVPCTWGFYQCIWLRAGAYGSGMTFTEVPGALASRHTVTSENVMLSIL